MLIPDLQCWIYRSFYDYPAWSGVADGRETGLQQSADEVRTWLGMRSLKTTGAAQSRAVQRADVWNVIRERKIREKSSGTSGIFCPLQIETGGSLRKWKLSRLPPSGALMTEQEGVRHRNCFNLFVYGRWQRGLAHGTRFLFFFYLFLKFYWEHMERIYHHLHWSGLNDFIN